MSDQVGNQNVGFLMTRLICLFLGTTGDTSMQQYILQAAVYIANLFFLTSDTSVSIVKDTELDEEDAGGTVL